MADAAGPLPSGLSRRRKMLLFGGIGTVVAVVVVLALVLTVGQEGKKTGGRTTTKSGTITSEGLQDGSTSTGNVPDKAASPSSSMGNMPGMGNMPDMPGMPSMPGMPNMPGMDMGGGGKQPEYFSTCVAADGDQLKQLVEESSCDSISLSQPEYMLMEPIEVTRHVAVVGSPLVLPLLDASMIVRAFRVTSGGFLELKFVKVRQGMGEIIPRFSLPKRRKAQAMPGMDMPAAGGAGGGGGGGMAGMADMASAVNALMEVRGGAVAVEAGADGATFVGVIFLYLMNTPEAVQMAITQTLNFVGMRMYGGHVFVAGGVVTFTNCHFWDSVIVMPLNDQVMIGGDVLVLAGEVFFTGCSFTMTTLFGSMYGVGFQVAVLGGTAVFTFVTVQAQGVAQNTMGAGMVFFVGGGVMVLTAVDFRMVAAVMSWAGIGNFFVGAGVLIETGMTIENAWGAMVMLGAGYYQAVGAGVHVQTGVTYVQYVGPMYMGLTGGASFLGTGTSINTGVSSIFSASTASFQGQGMFAYNGAGYSHYVGCPISMFMATLLFTGLGMMYSQPAGTIVFIGNPIMMATGPHFFAGLGTVMFVGGGSATLGYSPVYMPMAPVYMVPEMGAAFWINGNDMASSCGSPVYVDASGVYGRMERSMTFEADPLFEFLNGQTFDPTTDDPLPYHNSTLTYYAFNVTTDDFNDYIPLDSRRRVLHNDPPADNSSSPHNDTMGGGGALLEEFDFGSPFLDPLNAFSAFMEVYGDTSYIKGYSWVSSMDTGTPPINLEFGNGGDFNDYFQVGMVMDCEMMDEMGMDHMTMMQNGIVMNDMPMWMSGTHYKEMVLGMGMGMGMGHGRRLQEGDVALAGSLAAAKALADPEANPDTLLQQTTDRTVTAQNIELYQALDLAMMSGGWGSDSQLWADPNILQAAESLQSELWGEVPLDRQPMATTMFFNGAQGIACTTCNVGAVAGSGADQCTSLDSCDPQEAGTSWNNTMYNATMASIWKVDLGVSKTRRRHRKLVAEKQTLVPVAVRVGINQLLKDNGIKGVSLSVFSETSGLSVFDDLLAKPTVDAADLDSMGTTGAADSPEAMQDAQQEAKEEDGSGLAVNKALRAVLVGQDTKAVGQAASLFKAPTTPDQLASNIRSALAGSSYDVESVSLTSVQSFTIPAFKSLEFLKAVEDATGKTAGSRAVRLTNPNAPAIGLDSVTRTKTYSVVLENWPAGSALAITAIGDNTTLPVALVVATGVAVDKDGRASASWTVPGKVKLPPGTYHLQAGDTLGQNTGVSAPFTVLQPTAVADTSTAAAVASNVGARRRKLVAMLLEQ